MKMVRLLFILVFLSFILKEGFAQNEQDTTLVRIETRDGNEFMGRIIAEDDEKIILQTQLLGEISIPKSEIRSVKKILSEQIKGGEVWFPNPQSSRYFWAPNGYGLKKGEGYYHNIWVLWNQFAYGITDNFSIGGTVIPLFLFAGGPTPVFINPKFSLPIKENKFNMGAGALVGTVLGESTDVFGIFYGVATFGNPDDNVSIGLGYGFAGDELASTPLINLSGSFRISSRWYFITENYFMSADNEFGGIIGGGGRWIIKKAALDFGLLIPVGADSGFIGVPWLGFTIPFGNSD